MPILENQIIFIEFGNIYIIIIHNLLLFIRNEELKLISDGIKEEELFDEIRKIHTKLEKNMFISIVIF